MKHEPLGTRDASQRCGKNRAAAGSGRPRRRSPPKTSLPCWPRGAASSTRLCGPEKQLKGRFNDNFILFQKSTPVNKFGKAEFHKRQQRFYYLYSILRKQTGMHHYFYFKCKHRCWYMVTRQQLT